MHCRLSSNATWTAQDRQRLLDDRVDPSADALSLDRPQSLRAQWATELLLGPREALGLETLQPDAHLRQRSPGGAEQPGGLLRIGINVGKGGLGGRLNTVGDDFAVADTGRLAGFKCPTAIEFGELPRTSTGKVQKFVLREREWQGRERAIG